ANGTRPAPAGRAQFGYRDGGHREVVQPRERVWFHCPLGRWQGRLYSCNSPGAGWAVAAARGPVSAHERGAGRQGSRSGLNQPGLAPRDERLSRLADDLALGGVRSTELAAYLEEAFEIEFQARRRKGLSSPPTSSIISAG